MTQSKKLDSPNKDLENTLAAVQAARGELKRLEQLKADQDHRKDVLSEALKELEVERGERVLAAMATGDGQKVIEAESMRVAVKRAELDTVNDVLWALLPKISAAKNHLLECKAAALRAEAVVLRAEANLRQIKTDELLKALEEWEGCPYVPMPSPKPGTEFGVDQKPLRDNWNTRDGQVQAYGSKAPGQLGGAVQIIRILTPKTELLRRRADFYDAQADKVGSPWPVNIYTSKRLDMPEWFPD